MADKADRASSTPKVTVAIPTYNRADFLREAIESVLSQTLGDLEIIVSDNASTDHTPDVVASFDDPRLTCERLPRNVGMYANFNRCLRVGSAPLLTVLHDDDVMLPDNLERKVAALDANPEAGLVTANCQVMGSDGTVHRADHNLFGRDGDGVERGARWIARALADESFIFISTVVARRELLDQDIFDEADGIACDLGLYLRLARRTDFAWISEPLTAWRVHLGSSTATTGLVEMTETGYSKDFGEVAAASMVKERFVRDHASERRTRRVWARTSRQAANKGLARVLYLKAQQDPSIRQQLLSFGRALSIHPAFVASIPGLKALLTMPRRRAALARTRPGAD